MGTKMGWVVVLLAGCMGSLPLDVPAPPPPPQLPQRLAADAEPTAISLRLAPDARWTAFAQTCAGVATGEADVGPEDALSVGVGCMAKATLLDGTELPLLLPMGALEVVCDAVGHCVAAAAAAPPPAPEAVPAPEAPAAAPAAPAVDAVEPEEAP